MGEDHLEIGAKGHRIYKTGEETRIMGHFDLGARTLPIGVTKDMEPLIRIKAGVVTARKLNTLLVNAPRKLKMKQDKCDTILWAKEYLSLKTGRSKNGMMTMLGVLSI